MMSEPTPRVAESTLEVAAPTPANVDRSAETPSSGEPSPDPGKTPTSSPEGPQNGRDELDGREPEPQTLRDALEREADPTSALRREAASRRRALRETEAERDRIREERDALRAQLDHRDRQEAERLSVTAEPWHPVLRDAQDLWLAADLAELRDEEGALDPARVRAVVARIAQERPHWVETAPGVPFDGGAMPPVPSGPSVGRALKDARRRG